MTFNRECVLTDLDAIDRKILSELRRNARLTNQELGDRVGLSPSPCARRVRALQERGVILGYVAELDEGMLGKGFSVFISVKLDHQIDDRLVTFERAISRFPEVMDCWLMTGNRDYLLRVAVSDLAEYEQFLTGRLTKVDGVASIESSIPIRRVKGSSGR